MKNPFSRRTFIASAAATKIPPAIAGARQGTAGLLSMLSGAPRPATSQNENWKDAGVIDLSSSPFAKLKTVPVRAVTILD